MIVFSWDDFKRLFTSKRRKIVRFATLCGALTFFFLLLTPLHYEAVATFKQSGARSDKSFDLKHLIHTVSTGSAESGSALIFLSDTVLEKVVQSLGLQVHLKSKSYLDSIYQNLLAELKRAKPKVNHAYFSSVIYTQETPLPLTFCRLSDTEFELLGMNGTIGEPFKTDDFQLTLKEMPAAHKLSFTLMPLTSAVAELRKKITIKTAREDKNLLIIKCRDTDQKRCAPIANNLMEMYEKYLIEENKMIIGAQLSYLKVRQEELSSKLDQDIQAHANTLKHNLLSEGFLGIKDEMEFILEPLQTHQLRLNEVELELKQIDRRQEKIKVDPTHKPRLVQRYSKLLAEKVSSARELKEESLVLNSRQAFMQEGEALIESLENDLTGISLESARSLFDRYSQQFDDLHAELKQIVFMRDHLFDPHFEISTLSNVLSDGVTQQIVHKSSSLEAELFDDFNRSLKDRSRLESQLATHKQFLKSHLEQTLQLGKIRSELIKEKLSSLYCVIKTHLTQEKEALVLRISDLKNSMQTLPELWAYENRLKFKAELTKAMMEGLVNIAETKNLSHHLYQVESRPLDKAKSPTSFIAPRLLSKTMVIFALSFFLFTSYLFIRSLIKGLDISLTTAKEMGYHISGALSVKSPLSINDLQGSDLETLRQISSFLLQTQGIVASLGERQTDFFPALTGLLQKHQKSSCVIQCSFDTITRGEPGLIQALAEEPIALQHLPSYDFLPSGGNSCDSVELLASKNFHTLIQELSSRYDYLFLVSRTPLHSLESDHLLSQSHCAIVSLEKQLPRQKEDQRITLIQYPVLMEV